MSAQDLIQFLENLPDYDQADGDDELVGYISGIADAVRILHGRAPEQDPRQVWDNPSD